MVLKESGYGVRWNQNSIVAFTDTETVKLDFDDTAFRTVRYWARRTMKYFKLGGFLILKSSKGCYHVVFNKKVTWAENMRIVAYVVINSKCRSLQKWFNLQCRKMESTLRVSPKGNKPSPRIVYREGKEDDQIREFLDFRKIIKYIMRKIDREFDQVDNLTSARSRAMGILRISYSKHGC
jgi:hypothetical protein